MCHLMKTVLALPVLGFVSIPLLFSAWLTISFALLTLCIRLGFVYIELVLALLVNFFTLPASSSSFLTFAPSEPPSPIISRRNSSYGPLPARSNDSLLTLGISTHDENTPKQKKQTHSIAEAHNPPTRFIDESRDFEGVGGWRSYRKRRGSHEKPSSTSSSVPSSEDIEVDGEIDADERAWLSLNDRLELPSQVIPLRSNVHSPVSNFHASMPASSRLYHAQHSGRHHHRSHTTSSLTQHRTGGLSLALSTRQGQMRDLSSSASCIGPFMTPQPYSQAQSRPLGRYSNGPSREGTASSTDNIVGNGGYFDIPRRGSWYMPPFSSPGMESPSASGNTTPRTGLSSEDRDASMH